MKRIATLFSILMFMAFGSASAQVASIALEWTAPGDDGVVGTATTYEMRWSTAQPDTTNQASMDTWWGAATIVSGMPAPLIAGTVQTKTVAPGGGFPSGFTYYFVMRAADEFPNWSPYSNVASKTVTDTLAPARVTSLHVQ